MAHTDVFNERQRQYRALKGFRDAVKKGETSKALGYISNELSLGYLQATENPYDRSAIEEKLDNEYYNNYIKSLIEDSEETRKNRKEKDSVVSSILLSLVDRVLFPSQIPPKLVDEIVDELTRKFSFWSFRFIAEYQTDPDPDAPFVEEMDDFKVKIIRAILEEAEIPVYDKIFLSVEVADIFTAISRGWVQAKFLSYRLADSGYSFVYDLEILSERIKNYYS